mgnify:FL=1
MIAAVASLTLLGVVLGFGLGAASRKFRVEGNPLVEESEALMPGANCGQCGLAGCAAAAAAVAGGAAPVTCCPPGGLTLAKALAERLGLA